MLSERASAKINLTLAVVGRRADGYHLLDSLVAFACDLYDELTLDPGPRLLLRVDGPTAGDAGAADDNLVLKAARALSSVRENVKLGAFHLHKRIPVAAGLGGGSADAAAALRLLARANGIAPDDPALVTAAQMTGADVSTCLASRARIMRGIGDVLGEFCDVAGLKALLVHPGAPCATSAVFAALGIAKGASCGERVEDPPVEAAALRQWIVNGRNDMQSAAIDIVPAIAEALVMLRSTRGCIVARMSGSGATCFGLYEDDEALRSAVEALLRAEPSWRLEPTALM